MKNKEEFERFIVLYWGQIVTELPGEMLSKKRFTVGGFGHNSIVLLHLRSIQSLTDKELDILFQPYSPRVFAPLVTAVECHRLSAFRPSQIDYLRSIGIAVPFMDYSVEDMVKMNWIKLKSV